jgi:ketosteroid isomerase-like protein
MGAYRAKDWNIILTFLHPQVYVLMRNPKGEQGTLGYKQLTEAYYQRVQSANAPDLRLLETKIEMISANADRAKMWAKLEAVIRRDGGRTVNLAVILEAEWLKENNAWLITDAVIRHDAP